MKKILFIVEAMGGGVFTYIVDLTNELANSYEMYVAYSIRKQTPVNYKQYFDKRIHLIEVKNFVRSINPTKDIRAFFEIRRIARFVRPDAIHLHSSKAGAIGRIAFDGEKIPLFYTPHGYSFLMKNTTPMKRMLYKAVEVFCGRLNCTTISCSEGENKESRKLTKRTACVSNGINIAELQNYIERVQKRKHPFTVFTIGRICYQKGPARFNEIAEALPNIRFLWIGDGELREELTASNIEITGWVERKEALSFAINADVFILTSLWEGLPISLIEAMYMKKPCVVSDVIGNRDVIQNGQNGFVCESVKDFLRAIKKVQEGDLSVINTAFEDILSTYNTRVMGQRYSEIYMDSMK